MVFQIRPRTSVPLSALMIVFALFPLFANYTDESNEPILTSWRNEQGEIFLAHRLVSAPVHYGLLHIVPAIIWSILMPLQYWDSLRKSRPALHRFCGYVVFACALILTISGIAFIHRDLSWSDPTLSVHRIYGFPILPSFNAALVTSAAPALFLTLCRALYLARNKRFAEHRRWAVLHGVAGYLITLQRVWMIIVNVFGRVLASSAALQEVAGVQGKQDMATISRAEKAAFAFTTWAGVITAFLWAVYLNRKNALPTAVKEKAI